MMSILGSKDLHTTQTTRHVVKPGETLWSIARKADPFHDTRLVVYEIQTLNRLGASAVIYPGQTLVIPMEGR